MNSKKMNDYVLNIIIVSIITGLINETVVVEGGWKIKIV